MYFVSFVDILVNIISRQKFNCFIRYDIYIKYLEYLKQFLKNV